MACLSAAVVALPLRILALSRSHTQAPCSQVCTLDNTASPHMSTSHTRAAASTALERCVDIFVVLLDAVAHNLVAIRTPHVIIAAPVDALHVPVVV